MSPKTEELDVVRRGAVDLIDEESLRAHLAAARAEGRGLRVKLGMDPSSPDLHFGHAVQLGKLRALQELGHTAVLIVGDATAMVGDPSGRNKLRPQLSRDEVNANLETYTAQARLVLDWERTEVRRNSEWFDAMGFEDLLRLAGRMTVAQMIQRDTFQNRMAEKAPIGIHEFLYPLMQGWDSVQVRADVEVGGTDQLFNLLVGRDLQAQEGQLPQVVLTMPLIDGLDGRKMSKSYGNAIQLTDPPDEVFGKVMSTGDEGMERWFELLTPLPMDEVRAILAGHPREAKARLAWELTRSVHGGAAADAARAAFDRKFARGAPALEDLPPSPWPSALAGEEGAPAAVLVRELFGISGSEARRKIREGALKLAAGEGVLGELRRVEDGDEWIARERLPLVFKLGRKWRRVSAEG